MEAMGDFIVIFGWATDPEVLGAISCALMLATASLFLANGYRMWRRVIRASAWGSQQPWWRSPRVLLGPVLHSAIALTLALLGGYQYARESTGGAPHPRSLGVGVYVVHAVVAGRDLHGDHTPCYVLVVRGAPRTAAIVEPDELRFHPVPSGQLCAMLEAIDPLPAMVSIRTSTVPGELDVSVRESSMPLFRPTTTTAVQL